MNVLVTGATGFVGLVLVKELLARSNLEIITAPRRYSLDIPNKIPQRIIGEITSNTQWSETLKDVESVIHIAARAHILKEKAKSSIDEFRETNTASTLNLARQAVQAGIKRFIFISTIGVNGNYNTSPFLETNKVAPQGSYAVSKYEAELGLLALATESDMEIVIIRPPLVYGPNAPGNFGHLLQWVNKRNHVPLPLPFGAIHNQRSLIALDNLTSFIIHCIDHPKAANEIFLISDGQDVSTTKLLQKIATAFGKKAWLFPVPVSLMTLVAKLLGKGDVATRLFGSLQIDSSKARNLLGWQPVITMDEQLKKIAELNL